MYSRIKSYKSYQQNYDPPPHPGLSFFIKGQELTINQLSQVGVPFIFGSESYKNFTRKIPASYPEKIMDPNLPYLTQYG
jgi:hypothetical protein